MVLEIAAGRLIAPYVGVSIFTWTSIIGVILAGLALGNWLGGVWADRGAGEKQAGIILVAAGLACLTILFLLTLVAAYVQRQSISLLSASFIYVASLFFVPAMLIGMVTPLLTTLSLRLNNRTGHVVGMLHALAAMGSIVGTFITGYWLIQYFGTYAVITSSGVLFFILAIPFVRREALRTVTALLVISLSMVFLTYHRQGYARPCDAESQYFCIRVIDVNEETSPGTTTAMILDHLLHGINHKQSPELIVSPYVHAMDELVHLALQSRVSSGHYFFAGGGSYTQPRALLARYPDSQIVVAEIDPRVTHMAQTRMDVDVNHMQIQHIDARVALQQWQGKPFDAIIGDVFHDVAIPYHLTTKEYARLIKSRLHPQGIYVLNVVDSHPDPLLVKALYKTLKQEFSHVAIWLEDLPYPGGRLTYVLSAANTKMFPTQLEAQAGFERRWNNQTDVLMTRYTALQDVPLLTDNFVPVERLIAGLITTRLGR